MNKYGKRLFIGIPAGYEIKPILTDIHSSIGHNPRQIRWVPPNNIHMTLSFLGNICLGKIPQLIQTLENLLDLDNFRASIEKTGAFPSNQFPKILWLGIGHGKGKILQLNKLVEKAVTSFKENRKKEVFIPHITIGRATQSYGKIDFLPFLEYVYSPLELDVNSVALYESQLLPEGTKYKVLFEFLLN